MKRYFLVFASALVVYLLVAPLRGGYVTVLGLTGFPLSLFTGCVLFFLLTLLMLKCNRVLSKKWVFFALLIGVFILELPHRLIAFQESLISLPDILFKVLAVVVAYGVFRTKNVFCKIVASIFFFTFSLWFSYYGYNHYIHKLNYGSFFGKTEQIVSIPLVFQNDSYENVFLSNFDCEYLILDFWTSSCGVCFQMFPEVQKVFDKWNNGQVQIYGVFCRNEKIALSLLT